MNPTAKKLLGYLATNALGDLIEKLGDDSVNFLWAKLLARLNQLAYGEKP